MKPKYILPIAASAIALIVTPFAFADEDEKGDHKGHDHKEDADHDEVTCGVDRLNHLEGVRVHLHSCKHVFVTVQYQGETLTKKFRPATTVGKVKKWASTQTGMTKEDAAEHILQLAGQDTQPDNDQHIGVFSCQDSCSVAFDLVPCHRING